MARKKERKASERTKKGKQNVGGNSFQQEFQNLKFVQEYVDWKDNCLSISGSEMGVVNIDTLWDFLIVHVFQNIRPESVNRGRDGEGAIEALEMIEGIIENEVLKEIDIAKIQRAAETLEGLKDSTLDPRSIVFTENEYDEQGEKIGETKLAGHYRTEKYAERYGGKAVNSDWYSGAGNPPSMALFGRGSESAKYAKPRPLLEIMQDISKDMGKDGKKIFIDDLEVVQLKGAKPVNMMNKIDAVEKYFDKAINNQAFWNEGGRLILNKLKADFATQEFKVSPREQTLARKLSGIGVGKDAIAGTIRTIQFTSADTPLIGLIDLALKRANKKTAPNGYRAWQNSRRTGFDYRRTAREKFGPNTKSPNSKVISKMWQQILWKE